MEEAFRARFDLVNRSIHSSIVPKRAQLIAQIVRLDHRIDEVKTLKNVIEKETLFLKDRIHLIGARVWVASTKHSTKGALRH